MIDLWLGRRSALLLAATLGTLALQFPAVAQELPTEDRIATEEGVLVIHPIHHAAMTLTWGGKTILIDPAPPPGAAEGGDATAEYKALPPPDLILVTHEHPDHFNVDILQAVAGTATLVAPQAVVDKLPDSLKGRTEVMANGDSEQLGGIRSKRCQPTTSRPTG